MNASEGLKDLNLPVGRMVGVLTLALAIALTAIFAFGAPTAQAKFSQPSCAKFKKKLKKAKSKAAKQRLKFKLKQCTADRKVYNQVKNSRFVGAEADGDPVDLIFCANGTLATKMDTPSEEIFKKGWRIIGAKVRGKNFTAGYQALIGISKVGKTDQFQVGTYTGSLAKKKGKWQSGIFSLGEPDRLGDVVRTSAKQECRKL